MHEAGALVAGASLVAAEAVRDGTVLHAFNAAGGLHHAMPARASGFCVYDDPALAIAWLLEHGVHPIAYVDVDVHHGDGVQAIFYEDPRVLTVSIHQSGATLFRVRAVDERGAGAAGTGTLLEPGPATGQLAAFAEIVPPSSGVRSGGARHAARVRHASDRPAGTAPALDRRVPGHRGGVHALARGDGGDTTTGGSYQATVVPRAWTLAFAEMSDTELPDALPESWIEQVEFDVRAEVPATFSGASNGTCWRRTERTIRRSGTCFPSSAPSMGAQPPRARSRCRIVGSTSRVSASLSVIASKRRAPRYAETTPRRPGQSGRGENAVERRGDGGYAYPPSARQPRAPST
jgi:acetoin utilization protein AcuC